MNFLFFEWHVLLMNVLRYLSNNNFSGHLPEKLSLLTKLRAMYESILIMNYMYLMFY